MRPIATTVVIILFAVVSIGVVTQAQSTKPRTTAPKANEIDALLAQMPLFTADDPWRKDISKEPVDANSAAIIAGIGLGKSLHPDFGTRYGIPFQMVDRNTPTHMPTFAYPEESDRVPYPIPLHPFIEGGPEAPKDSDRHILCIDRENWRLYELFNANKDADGWKCGSGAMFELTKVSVGQRQKGWTSADAAGLPIFPGLVRYDEVVIAKKIEHAVRFTVRNSRRAYISPATHFASTKTDAHLPPMGLRVRLKAGVDISGFPEDARVILAALKTYGMLLADNGGDWFVTGAPDPRWDDQQIETLKRIKGGDFEVVKMGDLVTR